MERIKLGIIDLVKTDRETLNLYNSDFAIYSGLAPTDIPVGTVFSSIIDAKQPTNQILGKFKIEHAVVLGKAAEFIPQDYNALLFISSDVKLRDIITQIEVNENGNFTNLCYFET